MPQQNQELRKCSNCRCTILLETYFSKNRKGEYNKTCNGCCAKAKEYRRQNKEKIALGKKKCYEEKRTYYINKSKAWVDENKEKRQQYLESTKKHNSEKHRQYLMKHKERLAVISSQYYKDKRHHCEHKTNKQSCRICTPNGHLKTLVTARIGHALKAKKSKKSKKTIEYLGCDIPTFREHLEKSFKEGMTWENQGEDGWDIDHIIPVLYQQDGIAPSLEEVGKRLHYTNCQAMWHTENVKKGNRYCGDYQSESESN
jgi:hypothetical protein